MIIDSLENLSFYEGMHPRFPAAFAFLKELIASGAADGRHVMPNADVENAVFVNMGTGDVAPKALATSESHEKYIDVQVVLSGEELMCVPAKGTPAVTSPYNAEGDYALYAPVAVEECYRLYVSEGNFAIFFANELHAPSMGLGTEPTRVRKAIIKVLA